jgi:hypothetical protein
MQEGAHHLAALDEAVTGRRKQRAIAKKPRPDGLQVLIEEIVANNPKIKAAELLKALRSDQCSRVIESINDADGIIEWHDEKNQAGTSPISGLKDRLTRARKRSRGRA